MSGRFTVSMAENWHVYVLTAEVCGTSDGTETDKGFKSD